MESADYGPLDSRKREIRLLTLLPAINAALPNPSAASSEHPTVSGVLKSISLRENPSYVALSYTWGSPTPYKTIVVNGKSISVGANLEAALRHIQEGEGSATIWADAICVDQANIEEKSEQVQIMKDIYAGAQHVLSWLGAASEDSDIAMDLLKAIGDRAIEAGVLKLRGSDLERLQDPQGDERLTGLKTSLEALRLVDELDFFHTALIAFSERAYWTRTWVLQEICLARDVILACGGKRLPLQTFSAASNFCGYARQRHAETMTMDKWMDPIQGPRIRAIMSKAPSAAPNALFGLRRRYQGETGDPETLFGLLKRTCFSHGAIHPLKATDVRDKVYGLLGLDPSGEQFGLSSDYSINVKAVYTDTTRALISQKHVNALAWSQQHKFLKDLPTWVPDFSSPIHNVCGENDRTGSQAAIFSASGQREITLLPSKCSDVIGLSGILIDTVDSVGTPWTPGPIAQFDYDAAKKLFNEVEQLCMLSRERRSNLSGATNTDSEAVWRIPCADQEHQFSGRLRASPACHSGYLELKRPNVEGEKLSDARRGYQQVMTALYERRPFISSKGFVGLAPAHSQMGDWICIIMGADFPFLLRKTTEGQYELIGEGYVHGIMDGEGLSFGKDAEPIYLC